MLIVHAGRSFLFFTRRSRTRYKTVGNMSGLHVLLRESVYVVNVAVLKPSSRVFASMPWIHNYPSLTMENGRGKEDGGKWDPEHMQHPKHDAIGTWAQQNCYGQVHYYMPLNATDVSCVGRCEPLCMWAKQ